MPVPLQGVTFALSVGITDPFIVSPAFGLAGFRLGRQLGRSGEVCTGAQLPARTRRTASRCTCNCRVIVPTRRFSTVCIRRICVSGWAFHLEQGQ